MNTNNQTGCISRHYNITGGLLCLTPCPVRHNAIRIGSAGCRCCPYFQGADRDKQYVRCTHTTNQPAKLSEL